MTQAARVTGAILAGGDSRRMGRNKALMPFGDRRLIDRVFGIVGEVFTELLLVTNTPEGFADLSLPMVGDVYPGKGALGGIYSAIYHAPTPYCFVAACDMPFLNTAVIRYLVEQLEGYDVVMPTVEGETQPLHAIYSKACLVPITRRLEAERLKIIGFLPEVRLRLVPATEFQHLDPERLTFANLNTPEDVVRAARRLQPWGVQVPPSPSAS